MRSLTFDRSGIPIVAVAVAAVAVLVAPYPGASFSLVVTRLLAAGGSDIAGISYLSDALLVLLAAGTAATLVWIWRAAPERRMASVLASLGVVVAYSASEGAKLLLGQPRPCVQWPIAGECPIADFSLPSNHATLAFAAVWVVAVATQRLSFTIVASAMAFVVAVGRVLQGVHYVHDVAAGALVGLVVPALLTAAALAGGRTRSGSMRS